jgi:hypothetical protein
VVGGGRIVLLLPVRLATSSCRRPGSMEAGPASQRNHEGWNDGRKRNRTGPPKASSPSRLRPGGVCAVMHGFESQNLARHQPMHAVFSSPDGVSVTGRRSRQSAARMGTGRRSRHALRLGPIGFWPPREQLVADWDSPGGHDSRLTTHDSDQDNPLISNRVSLAF